MAVTIKDVAKETNLAISTISKYINGGNVRAKNRKKIEQAIEKLGFVPNDAARGLKTSKTYMVGLLNSGGTNQHNAVLIGEIEKQLRGKGYSMTLVAAGRAGKEVDRSRVKQHIDFLINRGMDGLIIMAVKKDAADILSSAGLQNIPVVLMEDRNDCLRADCVLTDCTGGAYEIVENLIKKGHQKIAILMGPEDKLTAKERKKGYERVLEDYGIPLRKEYMIKGDFTYRSGYEGMEALWRLPERPTAVFATNYEECLGAMEAINKLGIRIPDELSMVTFDDFDLTVVIRPHLTAVRQPLAGLAKEACELLYRRMNGDKEDFPRVIRLKPECICRDSVADLYQKNKKERTADVDYH